MWNPKLCGKLDQRIVQYGQFNVIGFVLFLVFVFVLFCFCICFVLFFSLNSSNKMSYLKGRVMGPLLVLVCHLLGENEIVTCKIVSFLCSLVNFLLENLIVFFLEIKFQNGAHLKKKVYFWPTFHIFLVTREKTQKFLQHIFHFHTNTYFVHLIDFFPFQNC